MDAEAKQDLNISLEGRRVLLVDDEYYIADDLRKALSEAGADVLGPCPTLRKALHAMDTQSFDCALIDLNLHGESALPLADRLLEEGKPFAIATGYGSGAVPERLNDVPRIEKPFDPPALVHLLASMNDARAS